MSCLVLRRNFVKTWLKDTSSQTAPEYDEYE